MNEASDGLIDIVEPAAPLMVESVNWLRIAGLLAVLVLAVIGLWLLWKKKWPSYRAVKRLRKLQQQLLAGKLPPYEAILLLAQELQNSLGQKRLLRDAAPLNFQQQDSLLWPGLIKQIDAMRYQSDVKLDKDELAKIFAQAEKFLHRYSR